jgi:hypothetical protein
MDKIPSPNPNSPRGLLHAVSFLESFHAAGGIDQLLLPGEERMAGGADLRADFRLGGAGLEGVAAEAFHRHFVILGMDSFFHIFLLAVHSPGMAFIVMRKNKINTSDLFFQAIFPQEMSIFRQLKEAKCSRGGVVKTRRKLSRRES